MFRKILSKPWGASVLSAFLALSMAALVVVAATIFTLNVPSTVTVNPFAAPGGGGGGGGSPSNIIQVYPTQADATAGTNQIVTTGNITWPAVTQFGNVTKAFWVKNAGTGAVTVSVGGTGLPAGVTITSPTVPVAVGATAEVVGTLSADGSAAPGSPAFTTVFTSNGS